jgi:hypothetical protein
MWSPLMMSLSACQPCDGIKLVNANGPAGVNLWGRCSFGLHRACDRCGGGDQVQTKENVAHG